MRKTKTIYHTARRRQFTVNNTIRQERTVTTPTERFTQPHIKFDKVELKRYLEAFENTQKKEKFKNMLKQKWGKLYEKKNI